jgi:hypothetical protein
MSPSYPLIPGPPFLLDHLLGLLFIMHIIFMNFVIASPVLILWYLWAKQEHGKQFAVWLASALVVAFSFAINFGVASLLFTQVLFADRFFTANIILGIVWISIIGLLMAAFYGAYLTSSAIKRTKPRRVIGSATTLIVAGLVWAVAGLMISNYFLSTDQGHWHQLRLHPLGVLQQLTFAPRILHFLTGAFAIGGFWMVWISWWRERRGEAMEVVRGFRRQGLLLAAGATGVQISVGIWFVIWQPTEVWDMLFSGSIPATVWIMGVTTGLLMLGCLIVAAVFPDRKLWQKIATGLLGWTLIGMSAGRDLVRQTAFGPGFSISKLPYHTQIQPMFIFFLLLLAGIGVLLWMLFLVAGKPGAREGIRDEG